MMILKPTGAILPCCELPGGSFVNTKVIDASDGLPDLELTHPSGGRLQVSITDLRTIIDWACSP